MGASTMSPALHLKCAWALAQRTARTSRSVRPTEASLGRSRRFDQLWQRMIADHKVLRPMRLKSVLTNPSGKPSYSATRAVLVGQEPARCPRESRALAGSLPHDA